MSLTAPSNELETTQGSSLNTHLALAGWYSRGSLPHRISRDGIWFGNHCCSPRTAPPWLLAGAD